MINCWGFLFCISFEVWLFSFVVWLFSFIVCLFSFVVCLFSFVLWLFSFEVWLFSFEVWLFSFVVCLFSFKVCYFFFVVWLFSFVVWLFCICLKKKTYGKFVFFWIYPNNPISVPWWKNRIKNIDKTLAIVIKVDTAKPTIILLKKGWEHFKKWKRFL